MIAYAPSSALEDLPRFVAGVSDDELDKIRALYVVWREHYAGNVRNAAYFDGKVPMRPTGNLPAESVARIRAVLDWPEKAVTGLAERSIFEAFTSPEGDQDAFGLAKVLDDNRFDLELPQAISSAYKHSCSFVTTARGDVQSGEPEVLVMARSAEWSAATWDKRRRALSSFLAITSADDRGRPTSLTVMLPDVVLSCTRRASGAWVATRQNNPLREVLAEPLAYDPQLDRPFGRSRISRPVRDITDRALRAIVRTELSSDFYAAPRMYALGASKDAFARGKWEAAIDRWFAITRDEEGQVPTVGQFPQMTMQPLGDLYRLLASQFSGATGLPISSLGIVQDNPPSAEALYADDRRIVATANRQNRIFGSSLKRVGQRAIMLRDGKHEVTDEMRKLAVSWSNPAFTSPITSATALQALAQVFPWIGETEVGLEYAGFSAPEITRLLADKRRAQGGVTLQALVAAGRSESPAVTG